jgi:hypothetical protein
MSSKKTDRKKMDPVALAALRKTEAEYKTKQRAVKREEKESGLSDRTRRENIEARWRKNLTALSGAERKKLEKLVANFDYVSHLMRDVSQHIRINGPYNADPIYPICPEQSFSEIEAFAKLYPPTDGYESYKTFDFSADRLLSNEPYYFREFGLGVDSIDHVLYADFLHCFGNWYRENRHTLVLATTSPYGPEYPKTWEQVETLMAENSRLKGLPTPTPLELVQKTIEDAGQIGGAQNLNL